MWSTVCELIRLRAKKPKEERIEPKAADAEPVIRCKDCKSRSKVPCKDIFGENLYRCLVHECCVTDEDFCSFVSFAERIKHVE